jgi:hypothetical protein
MRWCAFFTSSLCATEQPHVPHVPAGRPGATVVCCRLPLSWPAAPPSAAPRAWCTAGTRWLARAARRRCCGAWPRRSSGGQQPQQCWVGLSLNFLNTAADGQQAVACAMAHGARWAEFSCRAESGRLSPGMPYAAASAVLGMPCSGRAVNAVHRAGSYVHTDMANHSA